MEKFSNCWRLMPKPRMWLLSLECTRKFTPPPWYKEGEAVLQDPIQAFVAFVHRKFILHLVESPEVTLQDDMNLIVCDVI